MTIRGTARPWRATRLAWFGAGLVIMSTQFLGAAAASAAGERAGNAGIVSGEGSDRPLSDGGSATPFSLRLPQGASCQGDSANAGYRVQGFMVPANHDPGSVRYQLEGPDLPDSWGLYAVSTDTYTQQQTANAEGPNGPGRIINIPAFSYGVFSPTDIKEGRYRIGIACSLYNETTRYWDTEIVVTRAPADKPAAIHWAAVNPTQAASNPRRALIVTTAVALSVAGAVTGASRRRRAGRRSAKRVVAR